MVAIRKARNNFAGNVAAMSALEPKMMPSTKLGRSNAKLMDNTVVTTAGTVEAIAMAANELRTRVGLSIASDVATPSPDNSGKRAAGALTSYMPATPNGRTLDASRY